MTHPLVLQLRFTRSEFQRALAGISEEDGFRRIEPMNSLGWVVAHLSWQEQRYWLTAAQGQTPFPDVNDAGFGKPASTPSISAMWEVWRTITAAADPFLETITTDLLTTHFTLNEKSLPESIGSMLRRMTYHYWYHIGESQAIRQLLGHTDLGVFVGAIHAEAPYIPE
ncbi:MAG TPA: DinB family protein [Aggregatilineales bacterium]|nr:DinB family protein [Anaerolineales bacterium]HRE47371.1 DinB family protein [Aggregatilineales bacterium]